MSEWKPIETAPRDGTAVDVWVEVTVPGRAPKGRREADAVFDDGAWRDSYDDEMLEWGPDSYGQKATVTHWTPLPAPPEDTP
jgi:hypothetical protein